MVPDLHRRESRDGSSRWDFFGNKDNVWWGGHMISLSLSPRTQFPFLSLLTSLLACCICVCVFELRNMGGPFVYSETFAICIPQQEPGLCYFLQRRKNPSKRFFRKKTPNDVTLATRFLPGKKIYIYIYIYIYKLVVTGFKAGRMAAGG